MKILQQPVKVKRNSRVNIYFDRPCTVFLMTEVNFKRYKEGASFKRLGGTFEKSPAEFIAPYDGTWHAVIEKGSHKNPKPLEGRVEILPPLLKEKSYYDDLLPEIEDTPTSKKKAKNDKNSENDNDDSMATEESEDQEESDNDKD